MFDFFFFFWQSIKDGTPTRAKAYIKTQKKKDGSYPNDIIRERCVCYSHALYIVLLMCVIKSLLLTYLTDALTFNTTYMRD